MNFIKSINQFLCYCDIHEYFDRLQSDDRESVQMHRVVHCLYHVIAFFMSCVRFQKLYGVSAITRSNKVRHMVQTNLPCDAFEIDSRHHDRLL